MTDPILGPPPTTPGCTTATTLDGQTCGRPAVVHIMAFGDDVGTVQVESCRRHAALARLAGDLVAEHPYGPRCDAGRCWPVSPNGVPHQLVRDVKRRWRLRALSTLIGFWAGIALLLATLAAAWYVRGWRP